jgi:threonine-phosphate decarboxylase
MPGLRLGYVTGCVSLLEGFRTNRMPWSVNQLAIQAGIYLLEHPWEAPVALEEYLRETNRLRENLQALGALDVWETETHFMLVGLRLGKASALKAYLAEEHGILIRDASNFEGLDERFFRIAAQTPEENDRLVVAIEQWMKE